MKFHIFVLMVPLVLIMTIPVSLRAEDLVETPVSIPDVSQTGPKEPQVESKDIRDPFTPALPAEDTEKEKVAQAKPVVEIDLQGIGIGPQSAYAIMNGDIYFEGEERNGIKLLAVNKQKAEIITGGERTTLRMLPEEELNRLKLKEQIKSTQQQVRDRNA